MGADVELLEKLANEYVVVGHAAFLNAHPDPCLMLTGSQTGLDDIPELDTLSFTMRRESLDLSEAVPNLKHLSGLFLVWIAKSPWNRPGGPIIVGRSSDADLVIHHETVSRRHARFEIQSDGVVLLTDTGSRNGTKVNRNKLKPNQPASLRVGDLVNFAKIETTFQSAEGLCEYLARLG